MKATRLMHLMDTKKLHGIACNHRRAHKLYSTSDRSIVTCRACLAFAPAASGTDVCPELIDGGES